MKVEDPLKVEKGIPPSHSRNVQVSVTNAMPYTMLGDPEAADMAVLTSTLSQRGEFFLEDGNG